MALVLVVEDNPANMKLAVLLLTHAGHEVLQARDAEEGIAIAKSQKPTLILMDIQLPSMDGLTATRLIKQQDLTKNIKIIALTALAMPNDREKIKAAGCDSYIAKPIRYQEFLSAVAALLDSSPS